MRVIIVCLLAAMAGCAADPAKVTAVSQTEAARLQAPSRKLSTFAAYERRPMVLGPAVTADPDKVKQARILEDNLKAAIDPLLSQWQAAAGTGRSGTLVIEPHLASLQVVSGGARFWAGAWVGNSTIDLDLLLIDMATGEAIARPRVTRSADAMTGAWSIGQSDQNLLDYIAAISAQYLRDNY